MAVQPSHPPVALRSSPIEAEAVPRPNGGSRTDVRQDRARPDLGCVRRCAVTAACPAAGRAAQFRRSSKSISKGWGLKTLMNHYGPRGRITGKIVMCTSRKA